MKGFSTKHRRFVSKIHCLRYSKYLNFLIYSLLFLMMSCFSSERYPISNDVWMKKATRSQANLIEEYFLTKGLPKDLSPEISIETTYRRESGPHSQIFQPMIFMGKKFLIAYDITAYILRPKHEEIKMTDKLKGILPFFRQNQIATLCLYEIYLTSRLQSQDNIYLHQVKMTSSDMMRKFSTILLTSDLLWADNPGESEHHFNLCERAFSGKIKNIATETIHDKVFQKIRTYPEQICTAPDPGERIKNEDIYYSGDPDCRSWFQSVNFEGKTNALPRCKISHEILGEKGFCVIRAKPDKKILLFRNHDGRLSSHNNEYNSILASEPGSETFLCDETTDMKAHISFPGSWFQYAEGICQKSSIYDYMQ